MSESFLFDVFLSHSAKDKAVVREIAERLRADGLKVWFDEWVLKPGDSIPAKIEEGLEHSRVLVLCMSANAFGSEWVQLEGGTFRFRDPLNKDRRFIPLRLDNAPAKGSLSQFLSINWFPNDTAHEQECVKLLKACRSEKQPTSSEQNHVPDGLKEPTFILLGHTQSIRSLAWSGDGRQALSSSADGSLRLWDVETGQCLHRFEGHIYGVWSAIQSGDGWQALSGSPDGSLRLWDVETGQCLRVFEGHVGAITRVAWSPDGQRALSGSDDGSLRLWDVKTGQCERILEGHARSILEVVWSPDGRRALSGSDDRTLRMWDVETGQSQGVFEGYAGAVRSVAWSPDGRRALSGGDDRTLRLWDVETGQCLRVFEGHAGAVWSVVWGNDGRPALTGSTDGTMRLWDVEVGQCLRIFEGHAGGIRSVAWSPDGRRALSSGDDRTLRLWDVETGQCLRVFEGHIHEVRSVAWGDDGQRALSGSDDRTLRLWDVEKNQCLRRFEGHTGGVRSVAWSGDRRRALSGSADGTLRLWDVETGQCLSQFEGIYEVKSVTWSRDGRWALSGSADGSLRLWDVEMGQCLRRFEGHTGAVLSVAWSVAGRAFSGSADGSLRLWDVETGQCLRQFEGHMGAVVSVAWSVSGRALSGSSDRTLRLWDVETGQCLYVFEGHTSQVRSVAWSPDGRHALSGSDDGTLRLWDVEAGQCLRRFAGHGDAVVSVAWSSNGKRAFYSVSNGGVWVLSIELSKVEGTARSGLDQVHYTNAKVLVVGDTHAGKTALTHRLATGEWKPSEDSTVGAWSTQWLLKDVGAEAGIVREVWLWDFGGQADQRLIHQLYMDNAALILLLFNADQEDVLPGLRDWQTAIRRCVKENIPHLLIAGRIDTGFKASRGKLQSFAKDQDFTYFETSAKSGEGCDELRKNIIDRIPWSKLEKRTSPRIFKLIKDEILKLRDEGQILHTFKELRELLRRRLVNEPPFTDAILQTVIGLLDGPGVVKELDYGTYVLLAPEWVNAYAQAVIRTLRSQENDLGVLPRRGIAEGKLIYQCIGRDGVPIEMKRLSLPEERVVLGEMERQLEQRGLCLPQGDKLVFPSHCGRDRPSVQEHPAVFVSYLVKGYLDDIYATLVVRLADSKSFRLKELWRDAADFMTLVGAYHLGVKLSRESGCEGKIDVYFGKGVTEREQVIFANYIESHLSSASDRVVRMRYYVCPHCYAPKGNSEVLMRKVLKNRQQADTECDGCGKRFTLWDSLEQAFSSSDVLRQVENMQIESSNRLGTRWKNKLLVLEISSRITSANQKYFELPLTEDEGQEMELEFTDDDGKGTGRRIYLQLKSGNSHLERRKDGTEIFRIKKQDWVQHWINLPYPVMLVIGTFHEAADRLERNERVEFADVRWMDISSVLRRESQNGIVPVAEVEFKGERLDMSSIHKWRKMMLAREA